MNMLRLSAVLDSAELDSAWSRTELNLTHRFLQTGLSHLFISHYLVFVLKNDSTQGIVGPFFSSLYVHINLLYPGP